MRIDNLKVNGLIEDIERYLRDLESFKPISATTLHGDTKLQYSVAFTIEQIVNECINLGNHVLAVLALKTPQYFAEIFENLYDGSLISKNVKDKMINLVKLRNIIAHRYGRITDAELVEAVKEIEIVSSYLSELIKNIDLKKSNRKGR